MDKITNKKDYKFVDLLGNKNNLDTGCYLQIVCAGIDGFFAEKVLNGYLMSINLINEDDYVKLVTGNLAKISEHTKDLLYEYYSKIKEYGIYEFGELGFTYRGNGSREGRYGIYEIGELGFTDFIGFNGKKLYAREDNYYQVAYIGKNNFVIELIEDAHIKEIYKIPKFKEV